MPVVVDFLVRAFSLYVHVLERTGAAARLAALPVPTAADARPLLALVVVATTVLLLYAALASGGDPLVRSFRAAALLSGCSLPLAALRLVPGPGGPALGGAAIVLVVLASVAHRTLSSRRSEGTASRSVSRARLLFEGLGLALSGASLALLLSGRVLPARLAFWSLFLLRLSIADLIDPSRLAAGTGLTRSAVRDVKTAMGRSSRPPRPARRLRRAVTGVVKAVLLALWLALPLAAALARGEVTAGAWPPETLHLRWYPPAALALTAVLLLGQAFRALRARRPLEAVRGAAVGLGTAAWLFLVFHDPAFEAQRHALPGLVLAETVAGFLLGAAARGR
ncbi:MAG TPA: hypothetical protein VE129_14760 [Thermoanaerobaculia bacterium]|nr:hypothetical protein [Thermoanaerobaculia bacterium]